MSSTPAQQWAIVELFGHQRIAGAISEQQLAGATFVRVDVPEVDSVERKFNRETGRWEEHPLRIQAHTHSVGGAAVSSIAWTDEASARLAATAIRHRPISEYSVVEALAGLPQADRMALVSHAQRVAEDGGQPG